MKDIIKRTEMALNPHVIRNGNIAYAIFTGYSEYYSAMIAGTYSGRVVRVERVDLNTWSDEDILEVGKAVGLSFDSDKNIKILRKGWIVE